MVGIVGLFVLFELGDVFGLPALAVFAFVDDATARFAMAYALSIDAQGRSIEAIAYLQDALVRFDDDPVLVATLANIYRRLGNEEAARALAQRLRE